MVSPALISPVTSLSFGSSLAAAPVSNLQTQTLSTIVPIRSTVVRCSNGTSESRICTSRRSITAAFFTATPFLFSFNALALLDEDDDDQLLEKIKADRKSKIQKRESLGSYKNEAAVVQRAVYKMSSAGSFIDEGDFSQATVVLGSTAGIDWVKDLKAATAKVSSSAEEKAVAVTLSSALGSLQAAVLKDDVEGAKKAFVGAAGALEKWTSLTGLVGELQGL